MELDQLRYFLRVAELRTFTRAAAELHISQPALSRSIQRLEGELGLPVFIRKPKTLELTEAGQLLQSRAEQVLAILDETKAEICDDGQSGRLRIGAIPTIAPYFLPEFLKRFSQEFPQVTVIIHEDTSERLLRACSQGEIDLAILARPISAKYVEFETLFSEELWLVLPSEHSLVDRPRIRLDDVHEYPFVMLDEAHCLSDNILTFCQRKSFQPSVIGKTNQLSMVQELVALGHGISLIPDMARRIDTSSQRIYRSFSGEKPIREIAMAWDPYRFQTRMLENFRSRLRNHVADTES